MKTTEFRLLCTYHITFKKIFFLKNLSQIATTISYEAVKKPLYDVSYYLFTKNLYAQIRIQRNQDLSLFAHM